MKWDKLSVPIQSFPSDNEVYILPILSLKEKPLNLFPREVVTSKLRGLNFKSEHYKLS